MAERRNRTMTLASLVERRPRSGSEPKLKLKPLGHELVESRVRALQEQCKRDKTRWTKKYGKRNLAMARTYEGSRARLRDMVRRTILGEELIVSAIGGSVTNGHQVDASETWINKLADWFNTFMPPPEDYTKIRAREKARIKKQKQKQSGEEQEGWRVVQASENGWKGINGAVPGEFQAVEPGTRLSRSSWLTLKVPSHSHRIRLLLLLSRSSHSDVGI
jgi:hypothetical protein